jgi:hypothetical protein
MAQLRSMLSPIASTCTSARGAGVEAPAAAAAADDDDDGTGSHESPSQ